MTVNFFINEITFSDGTVKSFKPDDFVVFVGPNNAGKSSALREINDKIRNNESQGPVITELKYTKVGSADDLTSSFDKYALLPRQTQIYSFNGQDIDRSLVKEYWEHDSLYTLTPAFVTLVGAQEKIVASQDAPSFNATSDAPKLPIQHLYKDDQKKS